jgi:hypothetical protein
LVKKLHTPAALCLLSERMSALETQRQEWIQRGDDPAAVDREIAQAALTDVVSIFLDYQIEENPLSRLLVELEALSAGASPSRMLAPAVTRHRRADAPVIEGVKGRLAAIMEFQQQAGLTRKAAGEWVTRNIPAQMKPRLGSATRAAVDSWLVKWGGKRGPSTSGRDGYLNMRAILADQRPVEQKLRKIIKVLAKSFPS